MIARMCDARWPCKSSPGNATLEASASPGKVAGATLGAVPVPLLSITPLKGGWLAVKRSALPCTSPGACSIPTRHRAQSKDGCTVEAGGKCLYARTLQWLHVVRSHTELELACGTTQGVQSACKLASQLCNVHPSTRHELCVTDNRGFTTS